MGTSDDALWIPVAEHWVNSSLFRHDFSILILERFTPMLYKATVGFSLKMWSEPGACMLFLSSAQLFIFSAGVYWLGLSIYCEPQIAFLVAVAAVRTNVDISNTGWGIYLGLAQPKSFACSAIPWILGIYFRFPQSWKNLSLAGALMGLIAAYHPITAAHICLVLGTILLIDCFRTQDIKPLLGFSIVAVISMAPYFLNLPKPYSAALSPLEAEAFRVRLQNSMIPSWEIIKSHAPSFVGPILLMAFGFMLGAGNAGRRDNALRIARFAFVSVFWAALGPIHACLFPTQSAIHLLRISGFVFLFALLMSGFILTRIFEGGLRSQLAAYGFAFFLFISAGGGRIFALESHFPTSERKTLWVDTDSQREMKFDKPGFLDLAQWAKQSTSSDDIFLAPPDGFASFRIYSQRSLFVNYKDGSTAMFYAGVAGEWFSRYLDVRRLYQKWSVTELLEFCKAKKINYVISEITQKQLNLPIVFENRTFRVYRVSDS